MKINALQIKVIFLNICYDILGNSLLAVGIKMFSSPNHIAPGGAVGVATLLNHLTQLPIGIGSLFVNIPLLLVGYRSIGRRFTLSTLRTVVIGTIVMDYVLVGLPTYTGDPLLAALFGGVLTGSGVGFIFMRGSTTGGSDIIIKLVQKHRPYIPTSQIVLLVNGSIMLSAAVVYQNIEAALYGLIMTFTSGKVMDALIYGANMGRYVNVVTRKGAEVAHVIMEEIHRGVTIIDGHGAYTGKDLTVLMIVVRKHEFHKLRNAIHRADPTAFVIATEANDIIGKGFNTISSDDSSGKSNESENNVNKH